MMINLHPFAYKYISSNGMLRTLIFSRYGKLIYAPYTPDDLISDTGYVKPTKTQIQMVELMVDKVRKNSLNVSIHGFCIVGHIELAGDVKLYEDYGIAADTEFLAAKAISAVRKKNGDAMFLRAMLVSAEENDFFGDEW